MHQARLQPFERHMPEIVLDRHDHAVHGGNREVWQLRFAQHQAQVTTLGDLERVGQGARHIGKQGAHLRGGLEILLACEAAHPALVGQDFAFRDAHPRFVGFVIVRPMELHRVRGHHRQTQTCGQGHGTCHLRLVFRAACALQLQIKTVRKNRAQLQRHIGRLVGVALHKGLTHRPGLRARQQNQAFRQLLQPSQFDHGHALEHVLGPGAGQQLTQVQVPAVVLHQKHHPAGGAWVAAQAFEVDLGTDDGFNALAPTFLVELDRAEQVVQVGDGQCGLSVFGRDLDHIVDAASRVNHREFGVKAKMDKHSLPL